MDRCRVFTDRGALWSDGVNYTFCLVIGFMREVRLELLCCDPVAKCTNVLSDRQYIWSMTKGVDLRKCIPRIHSKNKTSSFNPKLTNLEGI